LTASVWHVNRVFDNAVEYVNGRRLDAIEYDDHVVHVYGGECSEGPSFAALEIRDREFGGPCFKEAVEQIVGYNFGINGEGGGDRGMYCRGWSGVPGAVDSVKEKLSMGVTGLVELDFKRW
jgi:hypothetical protein